MSTLAKSSVQKLRGIYKNSKLVLTGHSLGAAMAVFCAL